MIFSGSTHGNIITVGTTNSNGGLILEIQFVYV